MKKNPRFFYDLCIRPLSTDNAIEMVTFMKKIGYKMVGIEINENIDIDHLTREHKDSIIFRISLKVNNRSELIKKLRKLPSSKTIIAIEPFDLETARNALVSKKVDLVTIRPGLERIVDKSTRKLLEQKKFGAVEINLNYALHHENTREYLRIWRYYYQTLRRAAGYDIPLVISSCAPSTFDIWHPYHILGFASLFDVPSEKVQSWLGNPSRALYRVFKIIP